MSAGYRVYRTAFGSYPSVDNFGVAAFTAYSVLIGVGIALRTDRRPVWWGTAVLMTLLIAYAVLGYYPTVFAARPMDRLDWLEGTLYTGSLIVVLALAGLRLTGTVLAVRGQRSTAAPEPVARG